MISVIFAAWLKAPQTSITCLGTVSLHLKIACLRFFAIEEEKPAFVLESDGRVECVRLMTGFVGPLQQRSEVFGLKQAVL